MMNTYYNFQLLTTIYILFTINQSILSLQLQLSSKINEIQHFIYYIPEKEIILCSNKIYSESEMNLIPNELKLDDKFTCMINLDENSLYTRLNLHILKIKSKNYKKDLLDIYLGETLSLKNINILRNYAENKDQSYLRKQIVIKFENKKIYFLKNNECRFENLDDCDFIEAEDALFRKRNLMLNIKLKESAIKEISLLEKKSLNKASDQCEPQCINGVCVEGDCYCLNGYMGLNCGVALKITDFRIGFPLLIIFFIVSFLVGMLIMLLLIKLTYCIISSNESKENSEEIDVLEKWTIGEQPK